MIRADAQVSERLSKHLRLLDVDRDEFENAVLGQYTDDHFALGLIVNVDERNATSTRFEHASASFVERFERVDRDSFDGSDAQCTLNVAEAVQFELVDLGESVGVLPVILHYIEVVGCGEEAGIGGSLGVPQGSGYDSWYMSVVVREVFARMLDLPHCMRMFKLLRTNSAVSSTINL